MLRNEDYTDRELLHVVDDVTTEDGWADTAELADRLGLNSNGGRRYVGARMSWMVRYKFCERAKPKKDATKQDARYRLTRHGRALIQGDLDTDTEAKLEDLSPGERVLVMRVIAREGFSSANPATDMLRREYLHHYAQRKRTRRAIRV